MKSYSIIIPVYNEEKLLQPQVERIISGIDTSLPQSVFELILAENGSTDRTAEIASKLASKDKRIKVIRINQPSYGLAFKEGLRKAKNPVVFQFDIDFWDIGFIKRSLIKLDSCEFVVGSKNLNGSKDLRPVKRRIVSRLMEKAINLRFPVSISDTHGLKAIKKEMVDRYLDRVVCQNHFFDSELLIRIALDGHPWQEIPVSLKELRGSRFPFLVRSREVIREFFTLLSLDLKPEVVKLPYAFRIQKDMVQYLVQLFM